MNTVSFHLKYLYNMGTGLNPDGRLQVFARGTDDGLWHTSPASQATTGRGGRWLAGIL